MRPSRPATPNFDITDLWEGGGGGRPRLGQPASGFRHHIHKRPAFRRRALPVRNACPQIVGLVQVASIIRAIIPPALTAPPRAAWRNSSRRSPHFTLPNSRITCLPSVPPPPIAESPRTQHVRALVPGLRDGFRQRGLAPPPAPRATFLHPGPRRRLAQPLQAPHHGVLRAHISRRRIIGPACNGLHAIRASRASGLRFSLAPRGPPHPGPPEAAHESSPPRVFGGDAISSAYSPPRPARSHRP